MTGPAPTLAPTRTVVPDPLEHPTIDVPTAAAILGCSADAAYDAIRAGTFPVAALRIGRRLLIPTKPLLDVLGL